MAEVACNEEFLFMEFVFPTSKVSEGPEHVTGVEGVMQVDSPSCDVSVQDFGFRVQPFLPQ